MTLTNFFRLNTPFRTMYRTEELTEALEITDGLRSVLFQPNSLAWEDLQGRGALFRNKKFTNVSFSKTEIRSIIFRGCSFEDCLFIATHFIDCEFHNCTFKGCNPFRIRFTNTFIDPTVFEGMLHPKHHWNIGIRLFQNLYHNSMEMHQRSFARSAEFNKNKWQRYVLNHDYPIKKRWKPRYWVPYLSNLGLYLATGYGIKSKFLMMWAVIILGSSTLVNYRWWHLLSIVDGNGHPVEKDWFTVVYYTSLIVGGVGEFAPKTFVGKALVLGEVGLGIVVIALFVALLVRLAIR